MKPPLLLLAALCAAGCDGPPAKQPFSTNEVYVAPWGKDRWAGIENAPVKTLEEALRRIPKGGSIHIQRAGDENLKIEKP